MVAQKMVHILDGFSENGAYIDGCSEHVVHVRRKLGVSLKKLKF